MAVLLLEKDPFAEVDAVAVNDPNTQHNVRRPLYGLQVKETRFAYISLFRSGLDGAINSISIADSSAPGGNSLANHNFIMQSASVQFQEKSQVIETFGDPHIFFYGERPAVLQVRGGLFNSVDFNWKNEWLHNYQNYLRGTKCVENRCRVYLGFDDILVGGYIMTTAVQYLAEQPTLCPFSFQLLITNYHDLSIGYTDAVWEASEARTIQEGSLAGYAVEYLTDLADQGLVYIDEATGEVVVDSGSTGDVPATLSTAEILRSASWVTGPRHLDRQWHSSDEALRKLDVLLSAQRSGADVVTARLAHRSSPGSFPLSARSDAVTAIGASLTTGVANGAAVIGDAPAL